MNTDRFDYLPLPEVPEGLDIDHPLRRARVHRLVGQAYNIAADALDAIRADGKRVAGECVLYSGGDDSTVLAHLFHDQADYAVHINTGIGIEQTRQFVRDTCRAWDLPLIEEHGESYRDLVLAHGFPGPAHHFKMYQRLKERGLRKVRKRLVKHSRRERVIFYAGRRRDESERRKAVPHMEREGSIVWVSPLVNWTKADMNTYRAMHPDVPRNPVSANLHMSGECLCGAFAKPGELDEIGFFYPEVAAEIRALEVEVKAAGHAACVWGQRPPKKVYVSALEYCWTCARTDGLDSDLTDADDHRDYGGWIDHDWNPLVLEPPRLEEQQLLPLGPLCHGCTLTDGDSNPPVAAAPNASQGRSSGG